MRRARLESLIAELAEGQWGLLTAAQARAAGISRVQLTRLADDEMLTRLAHGVYVLRGAAGMEHVELRAAWLGLDPEWMAADRLRNPTEGAVVSHASAARLHQLGDLDADRYEFTLAERKQSRRTDVRLHRAPLKAGEVTVVAGLPVTKPERVIVDLLADRHDGEHVARALAAAFEARSIDLEQLAPRLGPFAERFGFPAGHGDEVLDHLLEVGGVADQVVADTLVSIAQAHNLGLAEMVRAALAPQFAPDLAETMRAALAPNLAETMRAALAAQFSPNLMPAINAPSTGTQPADERRAREASEGTNA
jgi:predicted transcriptional regulator of viral defense system